MRISIAGKTLCRKPSRNKLTRPKIPDNIAVIACVFQITFTRTYSSGSQTRGYIICHAYVHRKAFCLVCEKTVYSHSL